MKRLLPYSFALLFLFFTPALKAGHLVGGEMTYECASTTVDPNGIVVNLYIITIKLYRDAFAPSSAAQSFDANIPVAIYDGQGNLVQTITGVELDSESQVPNNVNNDCVVVPPTLRINVGTYVLIRALVYNPFGYYITTERCCRSANIDNIVNAGTVSTGFSVFISGDAQLQCNDSPVFNSSPPVVICQGQPLFISSNAVDPDGDSLVYELCQVRDGINTSPGAPVTNQPGAPPYPSVPYNPPFSALDPMGGAPPLSINPQTGMISVLPTQLGEFAVGICIKEYRNDTLFSTVFRDFQYKVIACTVNVLADLDEAEQVGFREFNIVQCGDTVVDFINQSTQAQFINGYEWTVYIDSLNPIVDTTTDLTITFPGYGEYTARLVVNPAGVGGICSDTAYVNIFLYEPPIVDFSYYFDSCEIAPVFFTDETILLDAEDSVKIRLWDFGDGFSIASLDSVNIQRQYLDAGTYTVALTIENSTGCVVTHEETLTWAPTSIIDIVPSSFEGCMPYEIEFVNNSYPINGYTTDWDLGDGSFSTEASPKHTYEQAGIYTVSVFIESPLGCTSTDTFENIITIYQTPTAQGFATFDSCEIAPIEFTDASIEGDTTIKRWTWDLTDGSILIDTNIVYQFTAVGSYPVALIVEDYNNCTDTAIINVDWFPSPDIKIGSRDYSGCSPYEVTIQNNTFPLNGYTTEWDLGNGNFSDEPSPTDTYIDVGSYDVSLTVTSPTRCVAFQNFEDLVTVNPDPIADFTYNPEQISILEPTVQFTNQSIDDIAWQWLIDDGAVYFQENPIHTFSDSGLARVTLIATHPEGCQDTLTKILDILPDFTYWLPNAFTPNEDNINDGYRGTGVNLWFKKFEMKIWNRWGEAIFETRDPLQAWNGRKNNTGKWVKNGTYVVMVKLTDARGQERSYKSVVNVIR